MKPVIFPPGRGQARDEAIADRVAGARKYNRDRPCLPLDYAGPRSPACEDHIGWPDGLDVSYQFSLATAKSTRDGPTRKIDQLESSQRKRTTQ
jgi:hypothetical protein